LFFSKIFKKEKVEKNKQKKENFGLYRVFLSTKSAKKCDKKKHQKSFALTNKNYFIEAAFVKASLMFPTK
jgi:hypothetical protein